MFVKRQVVLSNISMRLLCYWLLLVWLNWSFAGVAGTGQSLREAPLLFLHSVKSTADRVITISMRTLCYVGLHDLSGNLQESPELGNLEHRLHFCNSPSPQLMDSS